MSLTWEPPTAATPQDAALHAVEAPVPERLRLCISMPILFGVSALLWGGIGLTIAWLIG